MSIRSEKAIEENTKIYIQEEGVVSERGRTPVNSVLLAMLVDRLDCFMDTYHSQSAELREVFFEADDWIYGLAGDEHFFSYVSSCESLGIDPAKLKLGLLNVTLSKKFVWKKIDSPLKH